MFKTLKRLFANDRPSRRRRASHECSVPSEKLEDRRMLFVTVFGEETFESGALNTSVWNTVGTPTVLSDQEANGPNNAVGNYAINLDAGILLDPGIGSPLSIPPFNQNDEIFTVLDLSTYTAAQLRYRVQAEGKGDDPETGDDLHVRYVRQGNSFTLARNTNAGTNNNSFNKRIISLPVNALNPITLHFRNDGDVATRSSLNATSGADDWYVDDIIVWGWRPDVTISNATVTEGGEATFTVSLSEDTPRPVSVNYNVSSDSASSSDFTGQSGTVTFPANTRTQTITVKTTEDNIDELTEQFSVNLTRTVNRYTINGGASGSATGFIVDDDPTPSVSALATGFSVGTTGQVSEGNSVSFEVRLDRPSSRDITVNYATVADDASVDDFTASSGTLTFAAETLQAAGQTLKTITVFTTDDPIDEPSEAFQLLLSDPSNAVLSANSSASVSIIDNDDAPTISIAAASGSEGDVSSSPLVFDVTLSNPSSTPITVDYDTASQSATSGVDFAQTAGTLTFAPGALTRSFSVAVIPDDEDETNETFDVILSNASPNSALGTATAAGTIVDDDASPVVGTDFPDYVLSEGILGDFPSVQIDASTTTDADSSSLIYRWDLGNDGAYDRITESAIETFTYQELAALGLGEGSSNSRIRLNVSDGTNSSEILVNLDVVNDPPEIITTFDSTVVVPAESGGWFRRTLQTADISTTDSHTITVDYGDGSPPVNTTLPPGVRAFALNHQYQAPGDYDVSVDVFDGTDITSVPSFTVSVALGSSLPVVNFATSNQAATEGDSVTLTATLSAPSTEDVFVPLVTSGGNDLPTSALDGAAFFFDAGETTSTIQVDLTPDGMFAADSSMDILLTDPEGAQLGSAGVVQLTVINIDSAPTVEFASSFATLEEGSIGTLTVMLSNPSASEVMVPLQFSGSATQTASDQFLFPGDEIRIPAGASSASKTFLIVDDVLAESAQTLLISMGLPTGAIPGPGDLTVLIPANDTPIVDLRAASLVVDEASGTSNILVDLSNPIAQTVEVPFTISGTADGNDFSYSPSTPLTFSPNQTSAAIDLTVIDDTLVEPGALESVVIEFAEPNVGLLGNTRLFDLRIADNDQQTIQFVLDRQTVDEDSGSVTFNVVSNRAADVDITIPVSVVLNSAEAEDLAQALPTSVTLPAFHTTTSFTIDLANDDRNEPSESFTVFLGTPAGGGLLGQNDFQQVTIQDDDPFAFVSLEEESFDELTRTIYFKVQLTQPTNKDVEIDYQTYGTATLGSDYTISPGSRVTIPAGEKEALVGVTIRNDATVEDNESVGIRLTNATHALVKSNLDRAAIVIENNDVARLRFATEAARFNEGATFEVKVRLNKPLPDDLIVPVKELRGSRRAIPNLDYRLGGLWRRNSVRIRAGQTEAKFRVSIADDRIPETAEKIVLSFGTPNLSTVQLQDQLMTFTINQSDMGQRKVYPNAGFGLDDVQSGKLFIDPDLIPELGPNDTLVIETELGSAIELSSEEVDQFIASGQLAVDTGSNGNNTDVASGESQTLATMAATLAFDPDGDFDLVLIDPAKVLSVGSLANTDDTRVRAGTVNLPFASEQGNLFGSTAFFDANQNGIADFLDLNGDGIQQFGEPTEPSTTTRLDGSFDLQLSAALDGNGDGLIDSRDGRFVLTGGIDTGTELPMPLTLEAAVGHYNISPLSTLAAKLVYDFDSTDIVAEQRTLNAFGIEGARFSDAQAIAAAGNGDSGAARIAIANAQIQGTAIAIGSLFTPLDNTPELRVLGQLIFSDMADKIQSAGSRLDLGSEVQIASIIGGIEFQLGTSLASDIRTAAIDSIAEANARLGALDTSSASLLADRARHEVFFIGQLAPALSQMVEGNLAPTELLADYTGTAADGRVLAAAHGILNPPRIAISSVRTPETDSSGVLQFEVNISGDITRAVDVSYETVLDAAFEGEVTPVSGTLTWQPGDSTTRIIEVPFQGDTEFEEDEMVLLVLTAVNNAVLTNEVGVGYILNDDALSFTTPTDTDANEVKLRIDQQEAQLFVNQQYEFEGFFTGNASSTMVGAAGIHDAFSIELGRDNRFLAGGLHVEGNNDAGDVLMIENSLSITTVHRTLADGSGEFNHDGRVITYSNLASVSDSVSPTINGLPSSLSEADRVSLSATLPVAVAGGDLSWLLTQNGAEVASQIGQTFDYTFPDNGDYELQLLVETSSGQTAARVIALPVENVSPTAIADVATVLEGDGAVSIDVLANDSDPADTLELINVGTLGTIGKVTFTESGVTYNPNGQFEWLAEGDTATDTFQYTVFDGSYGDPVADQVQPSNPVFTGAPGVVEVAQSFRAATNNVSGASIRTFAFGAGITGDLTISLYDSLPADGGLLLASGNVTDVADDGAEYSASWNPVSVVPGETLYLVFSAANENGGVLRLGGASGNLYPEGQLFINGTAYPNLDQAFTTQSLDTTPGSDTATVTVTITGQNDAPTADAGGPYVIDEGAGVMLDASGSFDVDNGTTLTFSWDVDGDGDFDEGITGETVTLTPAQMAALGLDDDTSVSLTVRVSDGIEQVDAISSLAIENVKPTLTNVTVTPVINEGDSATLTGQITDPGADGFTLVVNWGDGSSEQNYLLPAGSTSFSVAHPYLDDSPTGTPADTFDLTVQLIDDDGAAANDDPLTKRLAVSNVTPQFEAGSDENLVPAAEGDFRRSISFTDVGALDTHTVTVDFGDGSGSQPITVNTGNIFDLQHTYATEGRFTVSVTVEDDDTGALTDTFDVSVQLNDPPVAVDDAVSTDEDAAVVIDVLADNGNGADSDAQNNIDASLTTLAGAAPGKGILINNGDGTFSFDPDGDFETLATGESEDVSFIYQIEDAFGQTSQAVVTITVSGENDDPVVEPLAISVDEDGPGITVTADYSDIDASDTHSFNIDVSGTAGSVTNNNDGTFTYNPNGQFESLAVGETAMDSFSYIVDDGNAGISTALVTVTIIGRNDAPFNVNAGPAYAVAEGSGVVLSGSADDIDSSLLTFEWDFNYDGTTFDVDATGAAPQFVGTDDGAVTVAVRAFDGVAYSAPATSTVTVSNVDPRILGMTSDADTLTTKSNDGVVVLSGSVGDAGLSDTHSVVIDWGDGVVETVVAAEDLVSSPDLDGMQHVYSAGGIYTITVTVTDDDGGSVSESTTAVVQGVGLVDGVLYVIGTDGHDRVRFKEVQQGTRLKVKTRFDTANTSGPPTTETFSTSDIDQIQVHLCDGDDTVSMTEWHWWDPNSVDIPAVIDGGAGNDVLAGGSADDVLMGGDGNDWIDAGRGDDIVYAGAGNDVVFGGRGSDIILGQSGDDQIFGGGGRDIVIGGEGADRLFGQNNEDILITGDTNHDDNEAALKHLRSLWNQDSSFEDRKAAILDAGLEVIHDDDIDRVWGGWGRDWLLMNSLDRGC